MPKYLVFDIETTGTSPANDLILEVAAIAVSDTFEELGSFEALVNTNPDFAFAKSTAIVQEMHTKSGLWDDLRENENPVYLRDAGLALIDFLENHGYRKGEVIMAGNSVAGFDLQFVRAQMPELAAWFSHRTVDIGGVRRFLLDVVELVEHGQPPATPGPKHRALSDCEAERAEAEWLMVSIREAFDALGCTEVVMDAQAQDKIERLAEDNRRLANRVQVLERALRFAQPPVKAPPATGTPSKRKRRKP